jgi:F-type H+-transporting ATPase subunit b
MEFLHNSSNWVLISMVGFIALVYFKARHPILAFLDARTNKIKATLEEAERLRAEAEKFLGDSRKQSQEAATLAQKIVQQAVETADRIERESALRLKEDLARKEKQLVDRIARAEVAAVENVRLKAAEIAMQTAEHILHDALSKGGRKLVDDAISGIPATTRN